MKKNIKLRYVWYKIVVFQLKVNRVDDEVWAKRNIALVDYEHEGVWPIKIKVLRRNWRREKLWKEFVDDTKKEDIEKDKKWWEKKEGNRRGEEKEVQEKRAEGRK